MNLCALNDANISRHVRGACACRDLYIASESVGIAKCHQRPVLPILGSYSFIPPTSFSFLSDRFLFPFSPHCRTWTYRGAHRSTESICTSLDTSLTIGGKRATARSGRGQLCGCMTRAADQGHGPLMAYTGWFSSHMKPGVLCHLEVCQPKWGP